MIPLFRMSLRYRTLFILGLILVVLAGLFSALLYRFGTEQFYVIERQETERLARYGLAMLNDELAAMDILTQDWAAWDDTYAFIEDLNPAYIRSNLPDETFVDARLNLMLFVRTSGEVAFARAYDLEAREEMAVPQGVYDALPILTDILYPGTGKQEMLLLPEGALLVTARPILTSRVEGPARGTLIFGRFLSDEIVARINAHLGISAGIYRWDRPEDWPADLRQVSASLSPARPLLARPLNEDQIAGYALITDLYGNPALVLTVAEDREIYHQFQFTLRLFMVNVTLLGLLFAVAVALLLDHLVLTRLAALIAEVRAIGAQGNFGGAVTVRGKDELAGLAEAINDMLAAIEQARREREEQEARLWRLAENSPDVIYRLAFSPPRLEYVSPAITRFLGYPPEDFYTCPRLLFRLVHPEDRPLLRAALRIELPPGEPLILRWVNREGETVWAEHRHTAVRDEGGRVVAVEGIARDITERKMAEEAIRRHATQLEAIRQAGLDLTAQLGLDTLLHSIVRQAMELVGGNASGLYLYRPEEDALELMVSLGPNQPPIGTKLRRDEEGLSRRVWETGRPFWGDDYHHWEGGAPKYAGYPWTAVIGIPIRWGEEFLGMLIVQADPPRTFSAADADLLTLFATHTAVAITNAHLFASAEQKRTRLDFLYRLSQRLSVTLDVFAIAQEAQDALCRAIAADRGVVCLYEPTEARLRLIAFSGYSEQSVEAIDRRLQLRLGQGLTGWVALHRQTAVVDDVTRDERWLPVPGMDDKARAAISTPILVGGELVGVMTVHSKKPAAFTPEDGHLMEAAASVIGTALLNAQLYETEQERSRRLALVNQVAAELSSLQKPETVYQQAVERIANAFNYDFVGLMLMDEAQGDLVFVAGAGTWATRTPKGFRQKLDEGMIGWVARHGETLLANDVSQEPHYIAPHLTETQSELDVPLQYHGKVIGVLTIQSRHRNAFTPLDVTSVEALASHVAAAITNARLFKQERAARQRQETLYHIGQIVNSALDTATIFDLLTDEAMRATNATHGSVLVPRLEEGVSERCSLRGYSPEETEQVRGRPLALERGLNARAHRTRQIVYVPDVSQDADYFPILPQTRSELVVPILRGERVLGTLDLQSPAVDAFRDVDMDFLRALADQVAIALENARLYEEERHRVRERGILAAIATALNTLEIHRAFPILVNGLKMLTGCDRVAMALLEEDRAHYRVSILETDVPVLEEGTTLPLSTTLAWGDILAGNPHFCPDMSAEVDYEAIRALYDAGFRSYVSLPLRVGGRAIGALHVVSTRERHFRLEQVPFLQQVADALAAAMENQRLYQREREQRALAETLAKTAITLTSTLEVGELLNRVLELIAQVVPGDAFNIMLVEDDSARIVYSRGYEAFGVEDYINTFALPLADFPNLQEMALSSRPILIPDTAADPRWIVIKELEWLRSYVAAPIMVKGVAVGFLNVDGTRPHQFGPADAARLEAFAAHVATALENAHLYQALRDYASSLEARVRERTALLAAQYARLEAILRSTGDGIVLTDGQGKILQANPVAQRWLTRDLAPEDAENLREVIRNIARKAREQVEEIVELPGLDLQVRTTRIEGYDGDAAVVVVLHDVTRFKTLERLRARFISNISHELRTPITTIKTYIHLLRRAPELLPQCLDILEKEANWQARLVEDVLQISRLDSGKAEMRFQVVSLNELVEQVLASYRPLAQVRGLTLESRLAEPSPTVSGDSDALLMALNNLVHNAIQYTLQGGRVEVITVEGDREGRRWATVTVADTGIGIPKGELPYIFDRFFRGKQPRQMQIPGTGLGLSIVKEMVDRHGGLVTVESEEGKGSRFTLWLPIAEERLGEYEP